MGSVVQKQFIIGPHLDKGAFGNVHECIDKSDDKKPLVVKLQTNLEMASKEISAIININNKTKKL